MIMSNIEKAYAYIRDLTKLESRASIIKKFELTAKMEDKFMRKYGSPIYRTVLRTVLVYARQQIFAGYMVKEVAGEIGYKDLGAFCEAYRKAFGHLPGQDKPERKQCKYCRRIHAPRAAACPEKRPYTISQPVKV